MWLLGKRGGGAKILQKIMAPTRPLSVIKIVKYCGVGRRGGIGGGAPKSYKK